MILENWENAYKVTIPLPIGGSRECVVFFESQYNDLCMMLYQIASNELSSLSRIADLEADLLRAQMRISELEYVIGMLRGDLAS